jgi:hypothetical protein
MELTECIEEEVLPETEKKTRKTASVTVLIEDGISVSKDSNEYTVVGGEIKNKLSHFNTFEGAMQEVSDRLFLGKLTKRAEEGRADFESLVRLVEEHKAEMKEKFKL